MARQFIVEKMTKDDFDYLRRWPESWNNKLIDLKNLSPIPLSYPSSWKAIPSSTQLNIGDISKLSIEIIFMTFGQMDLMSLFALRQTNSHFKALIEQWQPFREIMTYAPDAVRAILATRTSHLRTAAELHALLFTSRCEFCGEHGEILQLLKFSRCCFRCLSTDRRLLAIDVDFTTQALNFSADDFNKIPYLVAPRQKDHWGQPRELSNFWLFDYTKALQFARRDKRHLSHIQQGTANRPFPVPTILRKRMESGRDRPQYRQFPHLDFNIDISPPESQPQRFLAAIYFPPLEKIYSIKSTTQSRSPSPNRSLSDSVTCQVRSIPVWYCAGCRHYWNLISPLNRLTHTLHTERELKQHLKACTHARLYWEKMYDPTLPSHHKWARVNETYIRNNCNKVGFHFPRHTTYDLVANNGDFEMLPIMALSWLERHGNNGYYRLYGNMTGEWDSWTWDESNGWIRPSRRQPAHAPVPPQSQDEDQDDSGDEQDDDQPTVHAVSTITPSPTVPVPSISLDEYHGTIYTSRTGVVHVNRDALAIANTHPSQNTMTITGPTNERASGIYGITTTIATYTPNRNGRPVPFVECVEVNRRKAKSKKKKGGEGKAGSNEGAAAAAADEEREIDWYFDAILGDEAASQASWATARANTSMFLDPYIGLMHRRWKREGKRYAAAGDRGPPWRTWGFDRL